MRYATWHTKWLLLLAFVLFPLGADAQQAEPGEAMEQFVDEQLTLMLEHAIEASDRFQPCLEGSPDDCTRGLLQLGMVVGRMDALTRCCHSYWPDAAVERQLIERVDAALELVQRPYGSLSRLSPRQAIPIQAELVGFKVQMDLILEEIQEEGGGTP